MLGLFECFAKVFSYVCLKVFFGCFFLYVLDFVDLFVFLAWFACLVRVSDLGDEDLI